MEPIVNTLYRGKRVNDGTWVTGYYVFRNKILESENVRPAHFIVTQVMHGFFIWHEVDPTTVGQYTSKQDKNGKRIFNGDILKGLRYRDHGQWGENVECSYVVSWDSKKCGWWPLNFFDGYSYDPDTFEVIGNIWDNPEISASKQGE